jgi:hypothetical protein
MTVSIDILNPLAGPTFATSGRDHHTPYGGNMAIDLDLANPAPSIGAPVRLLVGGLPAGFAVRAIVRDILPACASKLISDGGLRVTLDLEHSRTAEGTWWPSDRWVLYGHLDPVSVSPGQVVFPGAVLGALGPPMGPEYASPCAQGSHLHLEATGATWGPDEGDAMGPGAVMRLALDATGPSGPTARTLEERVAALEAWQVAVRAA